MERQGGNRAGSRASGVNKVFLLNTVQGLKSHNKREEEEDCWRQHALDHKARGQGRPRTTSPPRRREPTEAANESAAGVSEADARRFWAEQKERAMKATTSPIDTTTPAAGRGSLPITDGGDRATSRKRERLDESPGRSSSPDGETKRRKKQKKGKKRKKTKDKKKKRKLEDNRDLGSGGGSGDERDSSDDEESERGSEGSSSETRRRKSKRHGKKKSKKRRR